MPQLDPTWFASQLFWLLVTFILLYVVISRMMLPSFLGMMAKRKDTIDGDIAASSKLSAEAESAKATYEKALADARDESRKLISDAMAEHQAKAEKSQAELQEKISAKLAEAEKSITEKRETLLGELTSSNEQMAKLIAGKLTGKA